EKKRFDLEDKLYEYNKSDKCRAKLKCAKLKKYLKEICESERRARVRNQGYLKKFECVQTYVEHLTTSTEKLQKLKTEYEAEMKKMHLLLKDNMGMKDEDKEKIKVSADMKVRSQLTLSYSRLCRLCNHSDILKEDLEAYRTAVLHSFPDLKLGSSAEQEVRSEQIPDWPLLKTQGQCMKEHDNSLKEEATALLKNVLTEECDHRSAIHSDESSCSTPSILNDNNGIKEAKPALRLNSVLTREQEVSSGCGDESKEESIAATPVTGHRETDIVPSELFQFSLGAAMKETKAYQLLKKSTLQHNSDQTEERFESQFSSLDIGSSAFKTKTAHKIGSEASFSSSKGSSLSRHESKRDPVTMIKSNAFWGESDDSNSEIEAALRPRDHNTSDDFDDFYDT
ncbi:hypothetical protein STEG23_017295, partial [Scotinomys teguina]